MKRIKKYLSFTIAIAALVLVLVISAGNWIVNAGNDGRALVDYTNPKKTYDDTDYYDASHLFGAAGHFHLFASDQITLNAHCNGNFAVPSIDIGAACGTNQVDTANGEREMSYADKMKMYGSYEIKTADFVLGKKNTFTDKNGPLSVGPISENQIYINGDQMNVAEYQKIYLAPEDFIDFDKEFTYLREVSAALSKLDNTLQESETNSNNATKGTYNLKSDEKHNNDYIYLSNGVNILNCKIADISAGGSLNIYGMLCNQSSEPKDHSFKDSQSLIINVDCAGFTEANPSIETKYHCQCAGDWPHAHDESNYYPGSIVIWNFYDSSKNDKLYTGTLAPSNVIDGCLLIPNGNITTTQNVNGTLIAKKITIGGESHRADFRGQKPKLDLTTVTPTPTPTKKPTPTPTPTKKPTPTPTPTKKPTPTPTPTKKPTPTPTPTKKPTPTPTKAPTPTPTKKPTPTPTNKPTVAPSNKPTTTPSDKPTPTPTNQPTPTPTNKPTPTDAPKVTPTPTAPHNTIVPPTQTPKETPKVTAPNETSTPKPSAGTEVTPSATPKGGSTESETPSGKTKKKSSKKGNLIITVTDSHTGKVVPNATVKITKPNGDVKTYTTNKKGQIKLKNTAVGKYKGVVTKVPKGYHADRTKFTSKVKAATTTKEKVRIKTAVSAGRKTNTNSRVSSSTATNTSSQPQTGDSFDIRIPIALFLFAFIGIITAVILKKKSYYYYN